MELSKYQSSKTLQLNWFTFTSHLEQVFFVVVTEIMGKKYTVKKQYENWILTVKDHKPPPPKKNTEKKTGKTC